MPSPTDSVDAKLTPREAVLNRNAAELAGRGNINQLNHMGNMMAQQGIDLPTLHAQQGTEDVIPVRFEGDRSIHNIPTNEALIPNDSIYRTAPYERELIQEQDKWANPATYTDEQKEVWKRSFDNDPAWRFFKGYGNSWSYAPDEPSSEQYRQGKNAMEELIDNVLQKVRPSSGKEYDPKPVPMRGGGRRGIGDWFEQRHFDPSSMGEYPITAQYGNEDVMNNPRYYDEGTGSVQSNLPYDPSYPGPTNPTGAGSGVPTQKGIGLTANILGNLIFPGAGMLTGPLASWITKMMQGNSAQNLVQGAVQGSGQQPTNPVTPGGYGSQPVWGDNPYPGGFDPNASFNYGNPAGPNTQSGIGQLGSSGPGGGFFGSTVPGGNEQNFMPTLGVAMPDAGGGGAYGGNEMAKIAMHGAFHDIATPEQYEYVKQFLSGGGGGGGGGKGVGGGGKPMTQAYAGGTSNVGMAGIGSMPYQQQPMQMSGMGSQVGQLGVGSQVGQLGGVGGMPDRNFAHPMAGLMHPDMPRNFPHPMAGLMHPGMAGGAPMVAQPAAYGGGSQPAAVGNVWGGGFNAQGVPIAPAGGWNMQNSGYTGNPAEYGQMQSQVGHYATGTSDVGGAINPLIAAYDQYGMPPQQPQQPQIQNPIGYADGTSDVQLTLSGAPPWGTPEYKQWLINKIVSGATDYTYGPGSPGATPADMRQKTGDRDNRLNNQSVALPPRDKALFTPEEWKKYHIDDKSMIKEGVPTPAGSVERYYGEGATAPTVAAARTDITPMADPAPLVATTAPAPEKFNVGAFGSSLSKAGANLAADAERQSQQATSTALSMIGGMSGNAYSGSPLAAYYAALQNPTTFKGV